MVSVGKERVWALQATCLLAMFICIRSTQIWARCGVVTGLIGNGVMLILLTSWGTTHRTALNALMQDHVPWKTEFVTSIKLTAYAPIRSMLKSKYCCLMQFSLKVSGTSAGLSLWRVDRQRDDVYRQYWSIVYIRKEQSDLSSYDPRTRVQVVQ